MAAEILLQKKIGTGDFADTFRAKVRGQGSFPEASVKLLQTKLHEDPVILAVIARAYGRAARLEGKGIVSPFAFGGVQGRYLIAAPWIDGLDGGTILGRLASKEAMFSVPLTVEVLARVCEAVARAAEQGEAHGGIGPGNVVCDWEGKVHVLEFAVRAAVEQSAMFKRLAGRGKRSYRAPELARGARPDGASDVFALGALCFELLTARKMTKPATRGVSTRREDAMTPSRVDRRVPGRLDGPVMRALEVARTKRYKGAAELAADLREFLDKENARITDAEIAQALSALFPTEVGVRRAPEPDAAVPVSGWFSLTPLGEEVLASAPPEPEPSLTPVDAAPGPEAGENEEEDYGDEGDGDNPFADPVVSHEGKTVQVQAMDLSGPTAVSTDPGARETPAATDPSLAATGTGASDLGPSGPISFPDAGGAVMTPVRPAAKIERNTDGPPSRGSRKGPMSVFRPAPLAVAAGPRSRSGGAAPRRKPLEGPTDVSLNVPDHDLSLDGLTDEAVEPAREPTDETPLGAGRDLASFVMEPKPEDSRSSSATQRAGLRLTKGRVIAAGVGVGILIAGGLVWMGWKEANAGTPLPPETVKERIRAGGDQPPKPLPLPGPGEKTVDANLPLPRSGAGFLTLETDRRIKVLIDGKEVHVAAPFRKLRLDAGYHQVRMVDPRHKIDCSKDISIVDGKEERLVIRVGRCG
jgi:serine/threonine protein kinase